MPIRVVTGPKLVTLLLVALSVWLAAGCGGGVGSQAEEQATNFTVVAPRDVEEQLDLGASGPSVGDLYVFSGPIYDEPEERQLGRIDGQ